jgi:RNA polymerase sigma factor (TIGR02999 family)
MVRSVIVRTAPRGAPRGAVRRALHSGDAPGYQLFADGAAFPPRRFDASPRGTYVGIHRIPSAARDGNGHLDASIGYLIRTADTGDASAARTLFAGLYGELHSIAERELRRGGTGLTLGATTLLHEAYLNIVDREGLEFADRAHFLAYASRAMRGLTIDYARRRQALKRGGEFHLTSSNGDEAAGDAPAAAAPLEELALALDTLGEVDPLLAQLVDLRFFCGFTLVEIAQLRGVSERTVQRDWQKARLLLHHAVQAG